jgi:hypothetical protein
MQAGPSRGRFFWTPSLLCRIRYLCLVLVSVMIYI